MDEDLSFSLFLTTGCGIYWHRLMEYFDSPDQIYGSTFKTLKKIGSRIADDKIKKILQGPNQEQTRNELHFCEKNNINIISLSNPLYPSLLKKIYHPPAFLFVKGILHHPCIGIVGTRKPSKRGLAITEYICQSWKKHSITIVSGMAQGIDQSAHQNINSMGVLGSSLDYFPKDYSSLHQKMWNEQTLITEYPSKTPGSIFSYPNRNRIIAGLCESLVIVEAQHKSGALITAKFAQKQNRTVFAIPSSILQPQSQGTDNLILQKEALLLSNPNQALPSSIQIKSVLEKPVLETQVLETQVLEKQGLEKQVLEKQGLEKPVLENTQHNTTTPTLTALQENIIHCLKEVKQIDDLAHQVECSSNDLFFNLTQMETLGIIKRKLGNQYCLV